MDQSLELEGLDKSLNQESPEKSPPKAGCSVCNYKTQFRHNLRKHMRTVHADPDDRHVQKISFLCDSCAKPFKSSYGLNLHKKSVHEGNFKFNCTVCSKGFNQKRDYMGHLSSHDKILKKKCDFCKLTFQYASTLKRHVKAVHNTTKFVCSLQNRSMEFTSSTARSEHHRVVHDNKAFVCSVCNKQFKWRSSLKYHRDNKHKSDY